MLVQVSQSPAQAFETKSSLDFATRVRTVELGESKKNVAVTSTSDLELQKAKEKIEQLQDEMKSKDKAINMLKNKLKEAEEKIRSLENSNKIGEDKAKHQERAYSKVSIFCPVS